MVISTGTIRPSLACAWVAALNSLQNPMMLTPCWPSAGPTGGEGFAFPAGSWSFTIPVIFFAIYFSSWWSRRLASPTLSGRGPQASGQLPSLRLFYLHEVEFHWRRAAEDADQN